MEPADLLGFVGLAVGGFAAEDSAQVRRRDPVLAFRGEAMIGDAEEALDGNLDANLFKRLANRALLEGLGEVQLTPDNARPASGGRLRSVSRIRPRSSISRTPTPTLGP